MPAFQIDLTESAKEDLQQYTAAERKTIVAALRVQLTDQPEVETANRKRLRENPVAAWELRDDFEGSTRLIRARSVSLLSPSGTRSTMC